MSNLGFNIAGVEFKNPVMTASGTFGSVGKEFEQFIDLSSLGAIVVKGISLDPWDGNNSPRIAETYGGMINSVGLQNDGVDNFIKNDMKFLQKQNTNIIVNIAGKTVDEYKEVARRLDGTDIDMIELNISCPNVKEGGVAFGTNALMAESITKEVKTVTNKPLIVKLSPNVTDITEIARAVESGGADCISMINTLIGMKIDIHRRKPVLFNKIGGLSGPAIKPVAIRMVHQVSKTVKIPIIGMGGIMNGEDAIEFIMAGATGVAVGTANLINPTATMDVLDGIKKYMNDYNITDLSSIRGIID
ncbi:dihydroorotate dehydrogenase [Tepidibacter mesophilus]|uniref:dihydroorotate dehydrogenase n=1 Tax=Tepidibacter mesophilus TaxID=655607 RepID=UPI000C07DFAD|nr:dihydroorotate dehydrogenase [Tepidibacter mesophilus]